MSQNKKVVWLPYDMDTAIGINNEGSLVFSYNLEDTDQTAGGADIFNGQQSVLWTNLRDAFGSDIASMYKTLRSGGKLSYDKVEEMFEQHQAKWGEAIFNEDAFFKYLQPLLDDGDGSYLSMLQGSKAEQRKWWLYNRFRYMDSKYNAGDAASDVIQLRAYQKGDITVTPYADIYASIKYGSYLVQQRASRNVAYTLTCPLETFNDTEIYVYSSSQIASVGDLSPLKVGYADFSKATKLQNLKLGDSSSSYSNGNMYALSLGNNVLLRTIDVRNCPGLGDTSQEGHTQTSVDISGCSNVEHVYFEGTNILGLTLPVGGVIKTLHLPNTITNLTIRNQPSITDFSVVRASGDSSTLYGNISTLRLENVSNAVPLMTILNSVPASTRVRLIGFDITVSDTDDIDDFVDALDTMRGLDENGNNLATARESVSGTIRIHDSLTGAKIASWTNKYPHLNIVADHTVSYVYYYTGDGETLLYTEQVNDGGTGGSYTGTPSRTADAQYTYGPFAGWSKNPNSTVADAVFTNVVADRSVYAAYPRTIRTYTITFVNDDNTTLATVYNVPYGGTATYTGETPVKSDQIDEGDWLFIGWSPSNENITGATTCVAQYRDDRSQTVKYLTRTITEYESDSITQMANYSLAYSPNLTSITSSATIIGDYVVNSCTALTTIDLTSTSAVTIGSYAFYGASALDALIIRSTTMSTLSYTSAFNGTKIAAGCGAVYVPSALVATYKANTNWANYYIASIDDYPITNFETITDTWSEIFAAESDGTYSTKYSVGDTKGLDVNGKTVYMQIVAMDTDTLSAGGTAKITWISKGLIDAHRMNATNTTSDGWGATEMRTWLRETILPTIDSTVRSNIKEVTKSYRTKSPSDTTLTVSDTVWIPSYKEIGETYDSYVESDGVVYSGVFSNGASRIKYGSSGLASTWWLRSAYNTTYFSCIYNSGSHGANGASSSGYGVALGFCT